MMHFFVHNFGCRAEQADGAALERQLAQLGHIPADESDAADLVVLNTCTVTADADKSARAAIRRVHRANPKAKILVTGCYAQRAPQEIAELEGVTWVVGNSHKHEVARLVSANEQEAQRTRPSGFVPLSALGAGASNDTISQSLDPTILHGDIFAHTELLAAPVFGDAASDKTRPNLKVQDGCNNRCSFCIIPYTRGRSRSLKTDDVMREVNGLIAQGYKELVISGINLGRWGRDLPGRERLPALVRAILAETSLEKLRLSSVEPMDWSDELIELMWSSPRIAKHVHMPLQSGSDGVLRRMRRKYRPWHYADRITKCRTLMPQAAIGADVMVGFPGESDQRFEESRAFIASLPFTYLHVFTFSARPGTPAAALPDQVPVQIARERNRILRELAAVKEREFRASFIGRTLQVITLNRIEDGHTEALSDNFLRVFLPGPRPRNEWATAQIARSDEHALFAR